MPVVPSIWPLSTLVARNATTANATSNALQVICAWPVSGQYGPGSRVLYYVLVSTCVLAQKAQWLRSACLAAAMLFPAVAAIHGIVLAATHNDNAVDMDVYGAFQLCSIGILAAPVTAKLSRTYFNNPGRNAIFLWTGLILTGLLSLTIEFFRSGTSNCIRDELGNPISPYASKFFYNTSCGITCSVTQGPFSPLRGGSANNIYVIPAPDKLSFGTGTLLAAACCIPAILSLISMWDKIVRINWKTRFGKRDEDKPTDELIEGTNGATAEKMRGVNDYIRRFLTVVEVPVYGAAVLAILILGEMNLFSAQVDYQTEPIASIGQWAPIAGTVLALLGSLYLVLAAGMEDLEMRVSPTAPTHHCNGNCAMEQVDTAQFTASLNSGGITPGADNRETSMERVATISQVISSPSQQAKRSWLGTADAGHRRKVAKALTAITNHLGSAAPDRFDDSEFKHGKAVDFPEIPGEENRNSELLQIRKRYNQGRDADGNVTPVLHKQTSKAGSFVGSVDSRLSIEGSSSRHRATSQPPQSPPSPLLSPSHTALRTLRVNTLPAERTSFELQSPPSPLFAGPRGRAPRQRRDTLEVPSPGFISHAENNLPTTPTSPIVTVTGGQDSPAIVVSSDPDTISSAHTPP